MANRFCSRLREKARDETLEQTTHLKPIFSNHRMKYAAMIPHLDTLIYSRAVPVAALRARRLVDRDGEGRRTERGGDMCTVYTICVVGKERGKAVQLVRAKELTCWRLGAEYFF